MYRSVDELEVEVSNIGCNFLGDIKHGFAGKLKLASERRIEPADELQGADLQRNPAADAKLLDTQSWTIGFNAKP